jgi:nucleotide-binding universal stress UspA family protein
MLKILCPTDFSPNSEFAVEYAIHLSNAIGARLTFITSYKVPHVVGSLRALDEKIHEALYEDLQYFVRKFKDLITTGKEPEMIVVEGNTSVSILFYAKQHKFDLIIMGTKGSSGLTNVIMGSITKKFFEQHEIPILAIPFSAKELLTGNAILLSLDNKGINNEHSIHVLSELKKIPNTELNVFHVISPDEKIDLAENTGKLMGIVDDIIEKEGIDPVMEIKQYVDENNIGIVAMVGRKHSFWERLFLESNTTAELFSTNVPILMLPE